MVMLNVRINKELEDKLSRYSEAAQQSKSSVVKEALAQYLDKFDTASTPYQKGEDLFGLEGSNNPNNSSSYKSRLKEKLSEKHSH